MKKPDYTPRILLVEGKDEQRVIPHLVESGCGITWEVEKDIAVVYVAETDGKENLLKEKVITTYLKSPELSALGIMIDADEDIDGCWQSIKQVLQTTCPDLPNDLPRSGLIHHTQDKIKLGIWIMPDNINRGMLETFLLHLRPTSDLLELSKQVIETAKSAGAPFKDVHKDKAQIYSWLAWQNPPGRQMHDAIKQKLLSEKPQLLQDFAAWFCELYDLPLENVV